ncbi:hypothetical protein GGI15_001497 [Coemansia interrupta]|uniref:Uncharacterized protein n=1 Tax=Coemansia interrupta TaxID=1126814 RepID=A0A9W8HQ41_9FUNG|nr:hypothetical protein GGI15_001497 [Coemansia interrupta]
MQFSLLCTLGVVLVGTAAAGRHAPAKDEFKLGDSIKVECAQVDDKGLEVTGPNGKVQWIAPTCVETRRPLTVYYGRDGPIQCSVQASDDFQQTLVSSLQKPLRCRVKRNQLKYPEYLEMSLRIEWVRGRGGTKRIGGNFNGMFHGQRGNLVAASIYPVVDQALPETVGGVSTMQFNLRWYEGMSVLMANKRHEEEFIIQPVVALMFCILTACFVYVVGRVYVEGSVIPRILREAKTASVSDGNSEDDTEAKKTK